VKAVDRSRVKASSGYGIGLAIGIRKRGCLQVSDTGESHMAKRQPDIIALQLSRDWDEKIKQ
jgi:hypothetical protein